MTSSPTNGMPAVPTAKSSFSNGLHQVVTLGAAGNVALYIENVLMTTATVGGVCNAVDTSMPLVLPNEADHTIIREWWGNTTWLPALRRC